MGLETKIQWCDHTFNPWRGCTKVSAGCAHCYAEKQSKRNPGVLGIWGDDGVRVVGRFPYWDQLSTWDKAAKADGVRRRVFCASLSDVFENFKGKVLYTDGKPFERGLDAARTLLWNWILTAKNLDFLLVTKRPENVMTMIPLHWQERLPDNVWVGTSVEDQKAADRRIPHLLKIPAVVRFLSCEPLLGRIDLRRLYVPLQDTLDALNGDRIDGGTGCICDQFDPIDWVIVGGESGGGARPFDVAWARSLKRQCKSAGVALFMKQMGANVIDLMATDAEVHPDEECWPEETKSEGQCIHLNDPKGGDPDEWPADLRVREMPTVRK